MKKKQITISEEDISRIVYRTAAKIINESRKNNRCEGQNDDELEEGLGRHIIDRLGAMKDTFTKGGNYEAHKANRNLQRSRGDIESLKGRYGVQDGQNQSQFVKSSTAQSIEQIKQKYDAKRQQLDQQEQAEIERVTGKAQKQWSKYADKKSELTRQKNRDYTARRNAVNRDPYADFK